MGPGDGSVVVDFDRRLQRSDSGYNRQMNDAINSSYRDRWTEETVVGYSVSESLWSFTLAAPTWCGHSEDRLCTRSLAITPGKRATAVCVWRLVFASHRCLRRP